MNRAIYYVAVMFIVTMMISVAVLVLVGLRMDGTREPRERDQEAVADEPSAAQD
jgi:signal peptidase II